MLLALTSEIAAQCELKCEDILTAEKVLSDPHAPPYRWPIDMKENATRFLNAQGLEQYELPDENAFPHLHNYMVMARDRNERNLCRLRREVDEEEARLRYEQSDEYQLDKARQKNEYIQQLLKAQQEKYVAMFKEVQRVSTELHAASLWCLELERKMAANQPEL